MMSPAPDVNAAELIGWHCPLFKLLQQVGLDGGGEASRRLITQGGAYVNGERLDSPLII
jgi:hypothetical protein